jgi:5'-3' exonuclease
MHHAFHGLQSDGQPTGIIYGAVKAIHDLREKVSHRIVFCWDHGVPVPGAVRPRNWREEFLPAYKATRKHDDEDRRRALGQFPDLFKIITWLGYSSASVMGLEADDVIGILANEIKGDVLIFSTDKDFYQLLGPQVEILVPQKDKGRFQRINAHVVEEKFGIPVTCWAEYLALGGDSSDNIKPRRGMGPKTAARLVKEGARLDCSFNLQPPAFQKQHSGLESIWNTIRCSYSAARIPQARNDSRIAVYCTGWKSLCPNPNQHWENPAQKRHAEESFARYCADREMITLISLRRALFNSQGEQECQASPPERNLPPRPKKGPWRRSILEL